MRGSPFFEGVSQTEVSLGGQTAKMPVLYYDAGTVAASFPARLGALRRLMPDPRISPARLAPGLGVVGVWCGEFRDTDIGPYNEVAISVALNEPWFRSNLPGRALLAEMRRRQLHGWEHHAAVTTEIVRAGAVEFYNIPMFIARVEFEETPKQRVCRLYEGQEHILTLSGKRIATPRSEPYQFFNHPWMDGQPQSFEFKVNATAMGISRRPGAASLELGDRHPIARELAGLLVSRRPIQYAYVPRFEAILFAPEHLTPQLIRRLAAPTGAGAGTVLSC